MEKSSVQTFYRIVKKNPPVDRDLLTHQERRGDPPPDFPEAVRKSWDALSFFDTEEGARQAAQANPHLGKFIARFDIPMGSGITWEETIESGHYDVRGSRDELKRCLTSYIVPV